MCPAKSTNLFLVFASVLQDNIYVNAVNPGAVATNIEKTFAPNWMRTVVNFLLPWIFQSPTNRALTQLYQASSPKVESCSYKGQYFIPVAKHQPRLALYAQDEQEAERLWEWTEKKTEKALQAPLGGEVTQKIS